MNFSSADIWKYTDRVTDTCEILYSPQMSVFFLNNFKPLISNFLNWVVQYIIILLTSCFYKFDLYGELAQRKKVSIEIFISRWTSSTEEFGTSRLVTKLISSIHFFNYKKKRILTKTKRYGWILFLYCFILWRCL